MIWGSELNGQESSLSAYEICSLVRDGDDLACLAYERTVGFLAFGTVGLINLLNPEAVIYGDRIIEGGPRFLETAKRTLQRHLLPKVFDDLIVDMSTLQAPDSQHDPMLLGASVLVLEKSLERPSQTFIRST